MASASGKDISLYQGHGHATTTAPKHPERIDWPAAPSRLLEQAQDGKKLELSGGSFLQAKGGLIMGLAELLPASKALQASLGDLLESALARPGAFQLDLVGLWNVRLSNFGVASQKYRIR